VITGAEQEDKNKSILLSLNLTSGYHGYHTNYVWLSQWRNGYHGYRNGYRNGYHASGLGPLGFCDLSCSDGQPHRSGYLLGLRKSS